MKLRHLALGLPLFLVQCAPQCAPTTSSAHSLDFPPGAFVAGGCINIDATPKAPRLDFDGATGLWSFDGVVFGESDQEDSCIKEVAP